MVVRIGANAATKAFLVSLILSAGVCAADPNNAVRLPGTYSSLAYNAEGGDLLGYELRMIPTGRGLKGVLQIAEGGAGDLYLVDVVQHDDAIEFDVPVPGQKPGHFKGTLSAAGLRGTITFPSGATESVFLKRTTSYWERDTKR
jgi:hypothetical protein